MKKGIHPQYKNDAKFTCNSCKTTYVIGSTIDSVSVEVCANCHPHYTGKQNTLVDADDRIKSFNDRLAQKDSSLVIKKKKKSEARKAKTTSIEAGPKLTLKDMIKITSK